MIELSVGAKRPISIFKELLFKFQIQVEYSPSASKQNVQFKSDPIVPPAELNKLIEILPQK